MVKEELLSGSSEIQYYYDKIKWWTCTLKLMYSNLLTHNYVNADVKIKLEVIIFNKTFLHFQTFFTK